MDDLTERKLTALVELVDRFGASGLDMYKQAQDNALAEQEAAAKQAARDNPARYGLQRLEEGGMSFQGLPVLKQVETAEVTQDQLPAFAQHIGVKTDELMRVLIGERRSVVGRGGQIWQAWSSPRWSASRDYVDSTDKEEFRAMLEKEDQETRAAVAALNDSRFRADATYHTEPEHHQWR
jgi:hypothetical protein